MNAALAFVRAIIRFPLTGQPQPIDWNARLQATLRPDPQYWKRHLAGKASWRTRRET